MLKEDGTFVLEEGPESLERYREQCRQVTLDGAPVEEVVYHFCPLDLRQAK